MSGIPGRIEHPDPSAIAVGPGRLGVVADIHGNPFALSEVLRDGEARGVERWLVLGDVVAMGPAPAAVLDLLAAKDVVVSIMGNTERYVLVGDRPDPTFEQVRADASQLPRLVEVAASFAWTKGFLAATGDLATLAGYRTSARLAFPDGSTALAIHASMLSDQGLGISPDLDRADVRLLFPDPGADLVFGGHTHRASD